MKQCSWGEAVLKTQIRHLERILWTKMSDISWDEKANRGSSSDKLGCPITGRTTLESAFVCLQGHVIKVNYWLRFEATCHRNEAAEGLLVEEQAFFTYDLISAEKCCPQKGTHDLCCCGGWEGLLSQAMQGTENTSVTMKPLSCAQTAGSWSCAGRPAYKREWGAHSQTPGHCRS